MIERHEARMMIEKLGRAGRDIAKVRRLAILRHEADIEHGCDRITDRIDGLREEIRKAEERSREAVRS